MTILEVKDQINELRSKCSVIIDAAKTEVRDLTEDEEKELQDLKDEIEKKKAEIKALQDELDEKMPKEDEPKNEENKRQKNISTNKMNKLQYRFKEAVANREYNREISLATRDITVTGEDGVHDALIQEDFTSILEPLYVNSILSDLGIEVRTNQVNDVHVPKMSKGTVGFLGEIEPAQATGFEFNYITLRPKRIAAYYDVSEQFIMQDAIGAFNAAQNNLVKKLNEYITTELFSATASSDLRPAGIFNGADVQTIETFKDLCELEAGVEENNVYGDLKYALSPRAKSYFRQLIKGTNATSMVYEFGEMDGVPAYVSSAVPSYKFVYGAWNNLLFCSWNDGIVKISDSATGLITGEVRIYLAAYIDWAVLRPEAFAFGEVDHE